MLNSQTIITPFDFIWLSIFEFTQVEKEGQINKPLSNVSENDLFISHSDLKESLFIS